MSMLELKKLLRDGYSVHLFPSSACSGHVTVDVMDGDKIVAQVYGSAERLADLLKDVYGQVQRNATE